MKALAAFVLLTLSLNGFTAPCPSDARFGLVIHGGAGGWQISAAEESKYRAQIEALLKAVHGRLAKGESSLEAVVDAVSRMEDSGTLNAGKAGVPNADGVVELDASLMDGKTGLAGAVGGVKTLKNPIRAARLVMEKTKHVLLVGKGAENFAAKEGATVVPADYFTHNKPGLELPPSERGTVGAVALDCHGNLAAATSTGGLAGKMPGRLGDSPIIGAGTYANNDTVAVSSTGTGEYFIRGAIAHDVSALMEYKRLNVADATAEVMAKLTKKGGDGGVIAIDKEGRVATPFNSTGMLRGHISEIGVPKVQFH